MDIKRIPGRGAHRKDTKAGRTGHLLRRQPRAADQVPTAAGAEAQDGLEAVLFRGLMDPRGDQAEELDFTPKFQDND